MALNIPMPESGGDALLKGLDTGSTLMNRIMTANLERQRLQQQQAQFLQDLALKKQAEQRSESLFPYQLQQLKDVHAKAANEALMRNYMNSILGNSSDNSTDGNVTGTPGQSVSQQTGTASTTGNGKGGINLDVLKQNPMLRGFFKKQFGYDPLAETPDEKRQKDMEAKLEFDKKQAENKEQQAAAADIPHLQATKQGLQVMEQIASDQKNENLFGHWIEGHDLAAKRSSNPNAGTWQTYGLNPIINAEMKMSSRGNQLALKTALANKPNFAENRQVALAKIKASIKQIDDQIKQSQSKLPKTTGKFDHLSDEQLQAIVEGK